ncbi:MAG: hypothetical protein WB947_01090 [Thermoplasmata archaeon]
MPIDPKIEIDLSHGERPLESWPAEMLLAEGSKAPPGWLVLTSHRCLFLRRVGRFGGGKVEKSPTFAIALAELHSVSPRQFSMAIGYGDHYFVPGLELDGTEFRLPRDVPSAPVVAAILAVRGSRDASPA